MAELGAEKEEKAQLTKLKELLMRRLQECETLLQAEWAKVGVLVVAEESTILAESASFERAPADDARFSAGAAGRDTDAAQGSAPAALRQVVSEHSAPPSPRTPRTVCRSP